MLTLPARTDATGLAAGAGGSGVQATNANDTATSADQPVRKPSSGDGGRPNLG
jgi:hypothetical protein